MQFIEWHMELRDGSIITDISPVQTIGSDEIEEEFRQVRRLYGVPVVLTLERKEE